MSPALEAMHPLIYPATAPVSGAVASPFWWLTIALLGTLSGTALWYYKRHRTPQPDNTTSATSQLEEALLQLQQLPRPRQDDQAGPWLQQLNLLLKRFCAVRYPEVASHRLSGREWLAFLDSRCPAAGLTRWMILIQGGYLPECHLSDAEIEELHKAVTIWMRAHV